MTDRLKCNIPATSSSVFLSQTARFLFVFNLKVIVTKNEYCENSVWNIKKKILFKILLIVPGKSNSYLAVKYFKNKKKSWDIWQLLFNITGLFYFIFYTCTSANLMPNAFSTNHSLTKLSTRKELLYHQTFDGLLFCPTYHKKNFSTIW